MAPKGASSCNSNSGPIMPDSSSDDKMKRKGRPSHYTCWPYKDEALILRALAAGRRRNGQQPQLAVLYGALHPRFVRKKVSDADLSKKVYSLRNRFWKVVTFHLPLKTQQDRELHRLSAKVWGDDAGDDSDDDDDFDL